MLENKYIRLLQFLVGTEVDGDFGKNSKAAADALIAKLNTYRADIELITYKRGEADGK